MVRMLMMMGLVVGAYVAGYNGVTHVEVVEFVVWSMANVEKFDNYVECMMEYAENMKNNVEEVL